MHISVVGGGGHVGLPLSIALADASANVHVNIYDINQTVVDTINAGHMPFLENGAPEKLKKVIGKNLIATTNKSTIKESDVVIVVIGTPVDEFLNPLYSAFEQFLTDSLNYFKNGQTIILRSTVFPGTSEKVNDFFKNSGLKIDIAFCPERIAEGKAMEELYTLPQIISGFSEKAILDSKKVFGMLTQELIEVAPKEAELAKLFCNSWRYIQFATANQYYMLAESMGADFYRIYNAMTYKYPRTQSFPKAGFAAGPCLFKDTMQLSAFSGNQYFLGHSAMLVNEGLPLFIIQQLERRMDLKNKTVGILGMAFKGESDDNRASLSYKLKKALELKTKKVLCTDEFIKSPHFVSLDDCLNQSDIVILGAPHKAYKNINTKKELVDVWNFIER